MSLITRCPACATMFKVVPDQLRVSDGWVRCGQCNEVFDANVHLESGADHAQKITVAQQPPAPAPAPEPVPVEVESVVEKAGPVEAPFLEVNPRALHIDEQDIAPVVTTLREQRDNLGGSGPSLSTARTDAAPKPAPVAVEPEPMVKEKPLHSFLHKDACHAASALGARRSQPSCICFVGGLAFAAPGTRARPYCFD